jgi:hypothetical protein
MQSTTITNNDDVAKALFNIGKKSKNPKINEVATKYAKKNYEKKETKKPVGEKKKTQTDNLTKDEIKKLLEDYNEVDDINDVPIGTHMRYFTLVNGENKFRMGANLKIIDSAKGFVMLRNAVGYEFSVQLKGTTFFKKMTMTDIKSEYDKLIADLNDKVKKLKSENKLLKETVIKLEKNTKSKPAPKSTSKPAPKPKATAKNTKK